MDIVSLGQWLHLLFPGIALVLLLWIRRGRYLAKWEAFTIIGLVVLVPIRSVTPTQDPVSLLPIILGVSAIALSIIVALAKNNRRQVQLLKTLRAWALSGVSETKILPPQEQETIDIVFLLNDHNAREFLPKIPPQLAGFKCKTLIVSLKDNPELFELAQEHDAAILFHGLGTNDSDSFGMGFAAAAFLKSPFGVVIGEKLPTEASLQKAILHLSESGSDIVTVQRPLTEQAQNHPGSTFGVILNNALSSFFSGEPIGDATSTTVFFKSHPVSKLQLLGTQFPQCELRLLAAANGLKQTEIRLSYETSLPQNKTNSLSSLLQDLFSIWWRN